MLVYRGAVELGSPERCAALFAENGWSGSWVNGIFSFHHFHSTAHEVLGVVSGHAAVDLGGPGGARIELRAGDVVVLPAGTSHRNAGASPDFTVVGAYPAGTTWDLRRGDPSELADVLANIEAVPLPASDPVSGAGGPLARAWGGRSED